MKRADKFLKIVHIFKVLTKYQEQEMGLVQRILHKQVSRKNYCYLIGTKMNHQKKILTVKHLVPINRIWKINQETLSPCVHVGISKHEGTQPSGLTKNVTCFIQKNVFMSYVFIMLTSELCCFELCNIRRATQRGRPCLHFFNFWIKFSIQNVVLKVARRKISKFFACSTLFSCVFDESVY